MQFKMWDQRNEAKSTRNLYYFQFYVKYRHHHYHLFAKNLVLKEVRRFYVKLSEGTESFALSSNL
jgi:hypothetical protein